MERSLTVFSSTPTLTCNASRGSSAVRGQNMHIKFMSSCCLVFLINVCPSISDVPDAELRFILGLVD